MRKESFALRLRTALEMREMSQKELSQRTGINESSISTYLKGEYTARQKKVDLMAEALRVDSAWLMGFDVSVDYLAGKSSQDFSDINPSYSAKEAKLKIDLGNRVRERREALNLSQDEVARRLGYKSRSSINKLEMGINDIPQSKMKSLAAVLQTSVSFLMNGENDSSITDSLSIGDKIKLRRKELGLSADKLAQKIGVDRATIYRYEKNDIKKIPINVMEALAEALQTSVSHLMGWVKPNVEGWKKIINNPDPEDFTVKMEDDSLSKSGIVKGSLVFIRKQSIVDNGTIAAVYINGEVILKRFYKLENSILLGSDDPKYPNIMFTEDHYNEFQILGKAVAVFSEIKY